MENKEVRFNIDEVLEIKGLLFKVVLVDAGAKKICFKQISQEEADLLAKQSQELN